MRTVFDRHRELLSDDGSYRGDGTLVGAGPFGAYCLQQPQKPVLKEKASEPPVGTLKLFGDLEMFFVGFFCPGDDFADRAVVVIKADACLDVVFHLVRIHPG